MNSYLLKKSIHNIHLEWKQWNSTIPRQIFHFEQVRFLLLPPLGLAMTCRFQVLLPASFGGSVTGTYRPLLRCVIGQPGTTWPHAGCSSVRRASTAPIQARRGILTTLASNRKKTPIKIRRGQFLRGSTPQGKKKGTACTCSSSTTPHSEKHEEAVTEYKGDCFLKYQAQ